MVLWLMVAPESGRAYWITFRYRVGARGVVGRHGITAVCSWLVCGW